MKEGQVLARNIALAKAAEFRAEAQRVEQGQIPFIRKPLIDKVYSSIRVRRRL